MGNEAAIPKAPTIFKDPARQTSIYVNAAGKTVLEERLAKQGVSGMGFRETSVG